MVLDPDTLERLVPDEVHPEDVAGLESLDFHLERYRFAAERLPPGRVLDIACGVGYGTYVLGQREGVSSVLGVDLSSTAVDYAKARYGGDGVEFCVSDAMLFRGQDGFDGIVSLETVEHVPEPERFFEHLVGMLRPGGVLVVSVPVTPSVDLNPHHLHDFTRASFRALGDAHGLCELASHLQVQRVKLRELTRGRRFRRANLRPNLVAYYRSHPAAFAGRVVTTLRCGLANHYLTLAWRRS